MTTELETKLANALRDLLDCSGSDAWNGSFKLDDALSASREAIAAYDAHNVPAARDLDKSSGLDMADTATLDGLSVCGLIDAMRNVLHYAESRVADIEESAACESPRHDCPHVTEARAVFIHACGLVNYPLESGSREASHCSVCDSDADNVDFSLPIGLNRGGDV